MTRLNSDVRGAPQLLILLGPTAVGKTELSIQLAKHLETDIISGDSMLLYRGFDIGSAKPSIEQRLAVRHHLVDELDADMPFSVTEFTMRAAALVRQHEAAGKLPFIVGGTGLYIKALIEGYDFNSAPEHPVFRRCLERIARRRGNAYLHERLLRRDPMTAQRLHTNDLRRVIRAFEVVRYEGTCLSQQSMRKRGTFFYNAFVIGLMRDRARLYERINRRVEAMFADGLVDEVAALLACGVRRDAPAMKGIGYKETAAYLAGEISHAAAVEAVQKATRHFAKRQLTWYRKMPYIRWYDADSHTEEMLLTQILLDVRMWQKETGAH